MVDGAVQEPLPVAGPRIGVAFRAAVKEVGIALEKRADVTIAGGILLVEGNRTALAVLLDLTGKDRGEEEHAEGARSEKPEDRSGRAALCK